MKRGDIVAVLNKNDQNWWMGEITRGNQVLRGLFPKTYVSPYTDWTVTVPSPSLCLSVLLNHVIRTFVDNGLTVVRIWLASCCNVCMFCVLTWLYSTLWFNCMLIDNVEILMSSALFAKKYDVVSLQTNSFKYNLFELTFCRCYFIHVSDSQLCITCCILLFTQASIYISSLRYTFHYVAQCTNQTNGKFHFIVFFTLFLIGLICIRLYHLVRLETWIESISLSSWRSTVDYALTLSLVPTDDVVYFQGSRHIVADYYLHCQSLAPSFGVCVRFVRCSSNILPL